MGWNEDVRNALLELAAAISGGELAVTLSAPIEADIIDADMYDITGVPPNDATLYQLYQALYDLLYGGYSMMPAAELLEGIRSDLDNGLYNYYGYEPWLQSVDRSISDGFYYNLYNNWAYEPWLQTVDSTLSYLLYDPYSYRSAAELLGYIESDLGSYLYNGMGGRPWLETIDDDLSYSLYGGPGMGQSVADAVGYGTVESQSWSALSAPGNTSTKSLSGNPLKHALQVAVANINTDVTVRFEGSVDGSSFFNMAENRTLTANGTYAIFSELPVTHVRGVFVSETGGTDATVTFKYRGIR